MESHAEIYLEENLLFKVSAGTREWKSSHHLTEWEAFLHRKTSSQQSMDAFPTGMDCWRHSTSTSSPLTATKPDYEGHQMASPFHFNMDQV